jgi:hypothetical protein
VGRFCRYRDCICGGEYDPIIMPRFRSGANEIRVNALYRGLELGVDAASMGVQVRPPSLVAYAVLKYPAANPRFWSRNHTVSISPPRKLLFLGALGCSDNFFQLRPGFFGEPDRVVGDHPSGVFIQEEQRPAVFLLRNLGPVLAAVAGDQRGEFRLVFAFIENGPDRDPALFGRKRQVVDGQSHPRFIEEVLDLPAFGEGWRRE